MSEVTLKRKQLESLDDEDLQPPNNKHQVVAQGRTIEMYGKRYKMDQAQVELLQDHCMYFARLWQGGFQEANDQITVIQLPELSWRPEPWDTKCIHVMVEFFSQSPRTLFRLGGDNTRWETWEYKHWLYLARLCQYFQSGEHYAFVQRRLIHYITQRRAVLGQTWDDLLPLFATDSAWSTLYDALTIHEEAAFKERWLLAYDFQPSAHIKTFSNLFDECLLINPFHPVLELSCKVSNITPAEWLLPTDTVISNTLQSPFAVQGFQFVGESEFHARFHRYTLGFFHQKAEDIHQAVPSYCLSGGLLSLLLHRDLTPFATELVQSDLDIWCLGVGDAERLYNVFRMYLMEKYQWREKNVTDFSVNKRPGIITVELLRPGYQRKFQFISTSCTNAANVILNFDFFHLQWYCEPVRRPNDGDSDYVPVATSPNEPLILQVRGTKQAALSMMTRWTSTHLKLMKQSRITKALKRGFHVLVPQSVQITRDYFNTTLYDSEFAPQTTADYLNPAFNTSSVPSQIQSNWTIPEHLLNPLPEPCTPRIISEEEFNDDTVSESESESSDDTSEEAVPMKSSKNKEVQDELSEDEKTFLEFHRDMDTERHKYPFETVDATFLSEYENFLSQRTYHKSDAINRIPNLQFRSTQIPLLDFRDFPVSWCSQWAGFKDNYTQLLHKFRIELPPLQATTVLSLHPRLSDSLLYLRARSTEDWNRVPILRAFIKFLTQLHEVAKSSNTFQQPPVNLNFYQNATFGTQLRLYLWNTTVYKPLNGPTTTVEEMMKLPAASAEKKWMRVVVQFDGINDQYWKYNIITVSEVAVPSSIY